MSSSFQKDFVGGANGDSINSISEEQDGFSGISESGVAPVYRANSNPAVPPNNNNR